MDSRSPTEAVLLRAADYGESDRVVTLFTRERGKVTAFARAARKSRKRFGGSLEPFCRLRVELSEPRRGAEGLLSLDASMLVESFGRLTESLPKMAVAGYACELCRELLPAHEPFADAFDLLVDLFRTLDEVGPERSVDPARAMLAFELRLLELVGHRPALDRCAVCGKRAPERASARLDPERGGVVCRACRSGGAKTYAIGGRTREGMVWLQTEGLAAARRLEWSEVEEREAQATTRALLLPILGREPRTLGLLVDLKMVEA